jgi:putative transposase
LKVDHAPAQAPGARREFHPGSPPTVKAGRFEPTSQVCSVCGVKDGPKLLHVRTWTCPHCGTVHDRDHNAAKNAKQAAGPAVTARRAQARTEPVPTQREEEGSHGIHTQRHSTR